MNLVLG